MQNQVPRIPPPPRFRHRMLRGELTKHGIEQYYLAESLDRSQLYVSHRMNGHAPWTMDEVYFMLDLLHIPYEQMHEYFLPRPERR